MRVKYLIYISLLLLVCLAPQFLANQKPILEIDSGKWSIPVVEKNYQAKDSASFQLYPLIPYSPQYLDADARNKPPLFKPQDNAVFTHWLGTDKIGRDILAGLLSGFKYAILIGLFAVFPALIIGTLLGWMSAYYGDDKFKVNPLKLVITFLLLVLFFYFLFFKFFLLAVLSALALFGMKYWSRERSMRIPLDSIITKLVEIIQSVPGLLLVLILGAIWGKGWLQISFLIAAVAWTSVSRYVRADVLKLNQSDFMLAVEGLGLGKRQVLWHYFINLLPSLKVLAAYGMAGAVFIESGISFLGLGLSDSTQTWGSMLADARSNLSAWWHLLFPSLCLFFFIFGLHRWARKSNLKKLPEIG